jgi:flavin-binding protein dodecin
MNDIVFEGESTYFAPGESDQFPDGKGATLEEAFENAAKKAKDSGHHDKWFTAEIQILTREQNQNVKTYKVTLHQAG